MTFIEDVQHARNPREALLNLAAGLDIIVERLDKLESTSSWDEWPADELGEPDLPGGIDYDRVARGLGLGLGLPTPTQRAPQVHTDGDTTDVDIPAPSAEKQEQRRMLEQQSLRLVDHLGTGEDWTEVYAKGGPQWLYIGNRELVMSLPESTRRALVADLEEDSPAQAHEMGRDILKSACEVPDMGAGDRALGVGNIG